MNPERPIVFVCHSLGGIVVKHVSKCLVYVGTLLMFKLGNSEGKEQSKIRTTLQVSARNCVLRYPSPGRSRC